MSVTPYALLTPVAFVRGVLDEVREVNTVQFGNEADVNVSFRAQRPCTKFLFQPILVAGFQ